MKQGLGTAVGGFPALFYFKPFFPISRSLAVIHIFNPLFL